MQIGSLGNSNFLQLLNTSKPAFKKKANSASNFASQIQAIYIQQPQIQTQKPAASDGPVISSAMLNRQRLDEAEKALREVQSFVLEQKELVSFLGSSDVSAEDKELIREVIPLVNSDIDSVADSAEFEGQKLLNGSLILNPNQPFKSGLKILSGFDSKSLNLEGLQNESGAEGRIRANEALDKIEAGLSEIERARALSLAGEISSLEIDIFRARLGI